VNDALLSSNLFLFVATCCRLSSTKVDHTSCNKLDRRQSISVDNTCDGRRLVCYSDRPPLSCARCREAARRAGSSATADTCLTATVLSSC